MITPSLRSIIAAAALLAAVSSPLNAATTIGVVLKGRSAFWSAMEKGVMDAARKEGAEAVVKSPLNESDIAVQIQLVNALTAQGVQALVLAPNSKDALVAPVAAAQAKGIKIVVVDSALNADQVFVGTNHTDAGTAAGKLLATLVAETDEVSFLKHSQTSVATNLREASALAALRAVHPKVVVNRDIFSGTEGGQEMEKARLLLTQHPNTKVVLASGTPGTMAMLKVIQEKQLAGKVKLVGFGFDLNPEVAAAIEHDVLQGWVAQLPREIGAKAVETALKLIRGESVPAQVASDFLVITKENLHDARVQALLAP
jgi:ribose transport system substrate-binding protein